MGRLLGETSDWVRANRLEAVRRAAAASGCVVLLKGADTLVARPAAACASRTPASPALATAGTGDVLTGVVAAMLARGPGRLDRGLRGRRGARPRGPGAPSSGCGPSGIIATDVIEALPGGAAVIGTTGRGRR